MKIYVQSSVFFAFWWNLGGIISVKLHLRRITDNASLTFEELTTSFAQIEAIFNSGSLAPLSPDPTDQSLLTPGHFLIGRPLTSVPSLPITCKRPNRYQFIEQLRQNLWDRWRQGTKWKTKKYEVRVGDLVILKQEIFPPLHWRLARITHFYPGPDGVSRVADVFNNTGSRRKAVNKMCGLPYVNTPDNEPNSEAAPAKSYWK